LQNVVRAEKVIMMMTMTMELTSPRFSQPFYCTGVQHTQTPIPLQFNLFTELTYASEVHQNITISAKFNLTEFEESSWPSLL
jgi:hypothetical protein